MTGRALDGIAYRSWPTRNREPTILEEFLNPDEQRVLTRCGKCGRRKTASFAVGREWFKTHECKGRG